MYKLFILLWAAVLIAALVTVSSAHSTHNKDEKSLKQVAIVFRHGLRTPLSTYPKDPYGDQKKYWPLGWGQLLPKGKQQLFKQGETFRKYYSDFIKDYEPNTVRVNSSDEDRCHMSAASLLAGWFPPKGDEIWNKKLPWQPIPIHSVPRSEDTVIDLKAPCPRYKHELKKVGKEIEKHETSADKELKQYLSSVMGEEITKIRQIRRYYGTLVIEKACGHKLPEWTKTAYLKQMKQKAIQSLKEQSWNDYLKRMTGGPLVKDIVANFERKTEGHDKHEKLFLYSAHDSTIAHVWYALGFKEGIWPDFGSALIFELHKSGDKHIVKIKYIENSKTTKLCDLKIPDCQSPCTLKQFEKITENIRAVDWNKDCSI